MTTREFSGLLIAISLVAIAIIAVAIVRSCNSPTPPQTIPTDSIQAILTHPDTTSIAKKSRKSSKSSDKKSTKPKSTPNKPINRPSPHANPPPVLPKP